MSNTTENAVTKAAVAAGVIPAAQGDAAKPDGKKATKRQAAKPAPNKAAKKAVAKPAASKKALKPEAKKATKAALPREFSKKAIVLDLLRRKDGAAMAEIAKATDWQNHTIRGFISGAVTKKMGLKVESTKNQAGERCYRIVG